MIKANVYYTDEGVFYYEDIRKEKIRLKKEEILKRRKEKELKEERIIKINKEKTIDFGLSI